MNTYAHVLADVERAAMDAAADRLSAWLAVQIGCTSKEEEGPDKADMGFDLGLYWYAAGDSNPEPAD
jgi:hypothetical protein